MSGNSNRQQAAAKPRTPRLSPELSEFLHMLSALESLPAAPPSQPPYAG
jgi:hypothetical protein